ncbi:response regulator transcription factor [Mucilaginibacter sp. UR6-1]|uniref:response regulator transcription factor n=1 Tax=Mucilaginibacter sp. UR6-1 TaxID=1435643 RepID=UPI001E4FB4E5|nr:response regulator transcription factor [Mucilaginibacter sp. UR6-1]MCC8411200.1 response regulator transcription factor [Mucilaginibacter sp. UR6-1]
MKILFVEDEPVLMEEMTVYFSSQGYVCEQATTFFQSLGKVETYAYDIAVLDVKLPDGSGLDLIPLILNKSPETGIIILTANNSLNDKLEGLNSGADDYLTKPFYVEELSARVNAIYRRKTLKTSENLKFADFMIDPQLKELYYKDEEIQLTKKEYQLLMYFVVNKNRVVSKSAIAEHIWGDNFDQADNFDAVYVHLTNLRKKLNQAAQHDYIKTVYGMGYKFSC